jgi:hypothetical protein
MRIGLEFVPGLSMMCILMVVRRRERSRMLMTSRSWRVSARPSHSRKWCVWSVGGKLVERCLQDIKPLPSPPLKEREQNLVSFDIDIFFARKDNGWIGG